MSKGRERDKFNSEHLELRAGKMGPLFPSSKNHLSLSLSLSTAIAIAIAIAGGWGEKVNEATKIIFDERIQLRNVIENRSKWPSGVN